MKNKPKKLAAIIELGKRELEYLLRCMAVESKLYVSSGRDFYAEEFYDSVKKKLENAVESF